MVSGLVTSPCDQLRIFSGEASEIRMESKSAIRFARSYGEERYILSAIVCLPSGQWPVVSGQQNPDGRQCVTGHWPPATGHSVFSRPPAPSPAPHAAFSLIPRPDTTTAARGSER